MKCPRLKETWSYKDHDPDATYERFQDCIGKECALWDDALKECSDRGILRTLRLIENQLHDLNSNLAPQTTHEPKFNPVHWPIVDQHGRQAK